MKRSNTEYTFRLQVKQLKILNTNQQWHIKITSVFKTEECVIDQDNSCQQLLNFTRDNLLYTSVYVIKEEIVGQQKSEINYDLIFLNYHEAIACKKQLQNTKRKLQNWDCDSDDKNYWSEKEQCDTLKTKASWLALKQKLKEKLAGVDYTMLYYNIHDIFYNFYLSIWYKKGKKIECTYDNLPDLMALLEQIYNTRGLEKIEKIHITQSTPYSIINNNGVGYNTYYKPYKQSEFRHVFFEYDSLKQQCFRSIAKTEFQLRSSKPNESDDKIEKALEQYFGKNLLPTELLDEYMMYKKALFVILTQQKLDKEYDPLDDMVTK